MPVAWLDEGILDELREIKDSPEFLHRMLEAAIADLTGLQGQLDAALARQDLAAVHRQAHAVKGVALSVGAVRLGHLASRLMTLPHASLVSDHAKLRTEFEHTHARSVEALRALDARVELPRAAKR
ncbi:MAG: Hpt domain-containing protein [Pseudoxanthomonas sp.]